MPTLHTPLCDLIGIEYPIIQAPMAGGPTTPDLVTAVSAAGALGSFGHAYTAPDAMRAEAAAARARTPRPFNLNLFTAPVPAEPSAEEQEAAEREQVGVHHPRQRRLGEPEVVADRGQRDVHDRHVDDDHQVAQAQHVQGEPA